MMRILLRRVQTFPERRTPAQSPKRHKKYNCEKCVYLLIRPDADRLFTMALPSACILSLRFPLLLRTVKIP